MLQIAGSIPASVSGFFIDIISFRSHYGPGVDSAFKGNEYQEYLLGQRRPMPKADNLPPSCAVVMKSGNLNLVEPSGPLRVYNGTALPLYERKRLHGRYSCIWEGNIKMDLQEVWGHGLV